MFHRAPRLHPMIDLDTPMKERPLRTPCEVTCTLLANGRTSDVMLVDYTDRGFRILSDDRLLVGTKIALTIPGCQPVAAFVRWSLGRSAGCFFEWPVRQENISAAVEASSKTSQAS